MINMWTVIIGILSLTALAVSVYAVNQIRMTEEGLVLEVEQAVKGLRTHIDAELEPLTKNINRAFGFKSEQAVTARQLKKAEGMIIQDVLDTRDPLIMGLLDMISPATKEYLEENPSLIVELIPRLQALSQVEGFSILDLLKPGDSSNRSRKHPFGFREE